MTGEGDADNMLKDVGLFVLKLSDSILFFPQLYCGYNMEWVVDPKQSHVPSPSQALYIATKNFAFVAV